MKTHFVRRIKNFGFTALLSFLLLSVNTALYGQGFNWHFNSDKGEVWGADHDNTHPDEDFVWVFNRSNWTNGNNWETMRLNDQGHLRLNASSPGLYFGTSSRLTESWGMRFSAPDSKWTLSTATSMLIGYAPAGENWGNGNLYVQNKVGIGTASPAYPLDVTGSIHSSNDLRADGDIRAKTYHFMSPQSAVSGEFIRNLKQNASDSFGLSFGTSGLVRMTIATQGNVGIGSANPSYKLDVNGSIHSANDLLAEGTVLAKTYRFLSPQSGGSGEFIRNLKQNVSDNYGLSFGTNFLPRMTIAMNGNVGIGTNNPDKGVLQVKGSLHVENDSFQVFHVSAGKALVFVGKTAYNKWMQAQSNGVMNQNNYSLWVSDGIVSEDYVVANVNQWSDYVFEKAYPLLSLQKLEDFINKNKHLPAIPSEAEVKKNGYSQAKLNNGFLKTIEELTLYAIEQDKKVNTLEEKVNTLEEKVNRQETVITDLQAKLTQYEQLAKEIEKLKTQVAGMKN